MRRCWRSYEQAGPWLVCRGTPRRRYKKEWKEFDDLSMLIQILKSWGLIVLTSLLVGNNLSLALL